MPCFTPLKAYWGAGGQVFFDSKKGYSDRPFELPCGQCRGCRLERSRQWALRCIHEAQMHRDNSFITLTYKDVPADGSLQVRDWQLFAKKLRKKVGKFRFFMCGEYGEQNLRPHYHACIFGQAFLEDRKRWNSRLYTSKLLEDTWGHGFTTIGNLTFQSAAYVARYVMKKVTGKNAAAHYEGRHAEFVCMSRRPGIGSLWFDQFRGDVFPSDEIVHEGHKFRAPRFYCSKLPEAELTALKDKRRRRLNLRKEDLTPEKLRAREEYTASLLSRSKRDI